MLCHRSILIWKLLLLALFAAEDNAKHAAAKEATCGRDPANIVSINDDLALAFCSDHVIRVVRGGKNATLNMAQKESLVIDPASATSQPFTDFEIETNKKGDVVAIKTREMLVEVVDIKGSALLSFLDNTGNHLFTREMQDSARKDDNESFQKEMMIQQSWASSPDESLYGGGQFVNGFLDYKAAPIHLVQYNDEIAIPFFISSRGYGILWDNYGETWLNPPNRSNAIDMNPSPTPFQGNRQDIRRASGSFTPVHSGDYWFSVDMQRELDYYNSNKIIEVTFIETPEMRGNEKSPRTITACSIHEYNIPKVLTCKATGLKSGIPYKVLLEYNSDILPLVFYTFIDGYGHTTIQTKDSEFIDYYLMVATKEKSRQSTEERERQGCDKGYRHHHVSKLDSLITTYRKHTGHATLFSKKAYGFWQCKQRYHNQTEVLDAAKKFRALMIPIDNIVQDWRYWGSLGWGPQWDKSLYPEPEAMIRQLHDGYDLNFMVSVWSRFDDKTKFYKEMKAKGLLINGTDLFDAWNPEARQLFFQYLDEALFSIGADAVWLDATEPEGDAHLNKIMYLGSGNKYRNTFSLEVNKAFHEGFTRKYASEKRPLALTRSSFSGQHRFASIIWSGDTLASFECLRRQITQSVNYQMSGDPYWTMDIGGFFRTKAYPDQYTSKEYQMLLLRWFQFAVFTPIMRVHGDNSDTELWNYGKETQSLIVESAINLRYRLIPYIYSGFRRVEQSGYTMGRAMAFDFLEDRFARNISDQFMFGESFLVAPIYNLESNRTFYLPSLYHKSCCNGAKWRDFYTGLVVPNGHYHAKKVDAASMLLFVRSSIVALAPKSQHVHDPIALTSLEVRIYDGKDSTFTLYEDDGIDPDPSRPWTQIVFSWSENTSRLHIGERKGRDYPGMPQSREIHIVLVRDGHGAGVDEVEQPDATLSYDGHKVSVDLSQVHRDAKEHIGYTQIPHEKTVAF